MIARKRATGHSFVAICVEASVISLGHVHHVVSHAPMYAATHSVPKAATSQYVLCRVIV